MSHFVTIERNGKGPLDDEALVAAMAAAGGEAVAIESEAKPNLKRVRYVGDPDRSAFAANLGGIAEPGLITWGSALTEENPVVAGTATAGTVGTEYSLTIHNNSRISNLRAVVFQQDWTLPSDVVSLAWLSKVCQPGAMVSFAWALNFNFVCGVTGMLKPGTNYMAAQIIPADLSNNNMVTLSYGPYGFEFGPTSAGPRPGSLFVRMSDNVPGYGSPGQGCVGIGMYGSGTFVTPTAPTGTGSVEFAVNPRYWVAFGNYVQGDVVNESVLLAPTPVAYPAESFHADCSFDGTRWRNTHS